MKIVKWFYTNQSWFARWLTARPKCKLPFRLQQEVDVAEFNAYTEGVNPTPEYEIIYQKLVKNEAT